MIETIKVSTPAKVPSSVARRALENQYPEFEVISFRRVKEAATGVDVYAATLRRALEEEPEKGETKEHEEKESPAEEKAEHKPKPKLDDDVVVEGKEHEKTEEEKLDEILSLIHKLIGKDEEVHDTLDKDEAALKGKGKPSRDEEPLPPPLTNPSAMANPMPNVAMANVIQVERGNASGISLAAAKRELEEGVTTHKVDSIKRQGKKIVARLVKK